MRTIEGAFTLVLLDADWPEPFSRWFGEPTGTADILRPYFHSYDQ